MEIEFKVRINPLEVRQQLVTSCLFAGTAILTSFLISLFIPVLTGFLLGLAVLLSYVAFKPYLQLRAQEKNPDCLTISHQRLIFYTQNKKAVSIPLQAIQNVTYDQGIVVFLRKPLLQPIEVHDTHRLKNRKKGDFFFEWFEPNVFAILNQEIKEHSLL